MRQQPPPPPAIAVPAAVRRGVPHLAAFFPRRALLPAAAAEGAAALVLDGVGPAWRPGAAGALCATEGPWWAPRFGRRRAPVALVVAAGATGREDPLALALAVAPPGAAAEAPAVAALLREARVGGAPGLPDPGAAGLGLPRGEAVLVLDPGRRGGRAAAAGLLAAARAGAGGRPVLVATSPDARPGARPAVPDGPGVRRLPGRLAPWTLLDLAAELHAPAADGTALLAHLAGVPVRVHGGPAPWAGLDATEALAALAAATRCADPFRAAPWTLARAIRQLADWRVAEAEHRRIVACTGIEWFKLRRLRAALSHHGGAPRVLRRGSDGIAAARREGGALAVWAATMPPNLPARCAAAGVPLVRVEDGFVRSAGLGVRLAPAASLVLDGRGVHYDASAESDLEHLLATAAFDGALLARAAALRRALTEGGVTKYNLGGAAPDLPRDPDAILVVGQVEDDAAMRAGGARAVRGNLALLEAVRRENPGATLLWKPHPDVEAGMRRGAVAPRDAARLADRVLSGVPIGPVYARVGAVHTISSLAGFEALLRGLRVACWGRPFYAGWGLTEDRAGAPPRRGRALTVDALVAGALILHARYWDPATGLPCPPEVVVERLAGAAGAPRRGGGALGAVPVPVPVRALVARGSRSMAEWWAAR